VISATTTAARHQDAIRPSASVIEHLSSASRQARGYFIADIRAAIKAQEDDPEPDDNSA
jgi:hypothetical protein